MPCLIVVIAIGLVLCFGFMFASALIAYGASKQKRRRAKNRVMADMIISGQRDAETKEINWLIDELLRLNNRFISESEEDLVRIEQLRRIRDEGAKDA